LKRVIMFRCQRNFGGAVAEVIKAIAAKRGVDSKSHGEIHRFITTLSKELNDSELLRCFGLASTLYQNFYENWLTPEMVVDYAETAKSLVERFLKPSRNRPSEHAILYSLSGPDGWSLRRPCLGIPSTRHFDFLASLAQAR
jgi:hypothetical protein